MKAIWNNVVIAESDDTILIEGNHYFPIESINMAFIAPSDTHTSCFWKGEAHYYTVKVDGQENEDAAWYYPKPMAGALEKVKKDFSNYVAFWRGIQVTK
jgi:uncharacterized protein (DUF427 family)